MVLAKWKTTLVVMLAWAGLAWGQAAPSPPPGIGIGSDLLTVREAGRTDQKCRILKTWKQPDGTMVFEVQCLETEEHLTLVEMAPSEAGVTDPAKGMKSRIYHWGQSVTPPAGVPQMPTAPILPAKDSKTSASTEMIPQEPATPMRSTEKDLPEKPEINPSSKMTPQSSLASEPVTVPSPTETAPDKVKTEYALPEPLETKLGPVQVETARPSNWHESWGKADDHHTQLPAEKISQAPATSPTVNFQLPLPAEQPSAPRSDNGQQMPLPAEPTAPTAVPNSEPSPPANLPSTIGGDEKTGDHSPDLSQTSGKKEMAPEFQPAGYSHIDDRPGIAHVTDIPPAGAAKVGSESKKPVVDFLRAMWKPSLKEPAPLQSVQINEMPVIAAVPDVQQIQATLQNSLLPSQREMAVEILSNWDNHREPAIVPTLLRAAREDPAATVRAACVHGLVKMRANSPQVVSVLLSLKADPDLRVRREAHQALISFGLAKSEAENEMIHQISAPGGPGE